MILRAGLGPVNRYELRQELRISLERNLRIRQTPALRFSKNGLYMLADIDALEVLRRTNIEFVNGIDTFGKLYDDRRSVSEPSWEDVQANGLVRIFFDRVWLTAAGAASAAAGEIETLTRLNKDRWSVNVTFDNSQPENERVNSFTKKSKRARQRSTI